MKTCPMCGNEIIDGFLEYWCQCGCGICCRADDKDAEKKIEAWKRDHKCKGKK